jgi:hypothetical protein
VAKTLKLRRRHGKAVKLAAISTTSIRLREALKGNGCRDGSMDRHSGVRVERTIVMPCTALVSDTGCVHPVTVWRISCILSDTKHLLDKATKYGANILCQSFECL